MRYLAILLFFASCSSEERNKEYVSDVKAYFTHHISIDSIIGMRAVPLGFSFYGGKMNINYITHKTGTRFSDNGSFILIDTDKKHLIFEFPNKIFYAVAKSFFYNDSLYVMDRASLKKISVYNINDSVSSHVKEIDVPASVHASGLQIKDSLVFFEGNPYGPSVFNMISGKLLIPPKRGVVDPSASTFAIPIDSSINFMMGFSEGGSDSISGYCFDRNLNIKWKITLGDVEGMLTFYSVFNCKSAFIVVNGRSITAVDKVSGKIMWTKGLPKRTQNAIVQDERLTVVQHDNNNPSSDVTISSIDISSGEFIAEKTLRLDGVALIKLSRNEKVLILTTGYNLLIVDGMSLSNNS